MIQFLNKRVIRQNYILGTVNTKSVLDIGCVAADHLMDLHKQIRASAKSCIGMDITPAKGVVVADAQNFDFDEKFDVIIAGEIIEHLANIKGFIDSVIRNLLPGGRLILTTPNPYSLITLKRAIFGIRAPNDPYHVCLFDCTTILNMFNNFAKNQFTGYICYYEESNPKTLPYKINKLVSNLVPGYSSGLLMNLSLTKTS